MKFFLGLAAKPPSISGYTRQFWVGSWAKAPLYWPEKFAFLQAANYKQETYAGYERLGESCSNEHLGPASAPSGFVGLKSWRLQLQVWLLLLLPS